MDELIRKQDALDAIHCNITVTGRRNAELVAAAIGAFIDRIKALPPVQFGMSLAEVGTYVPDMNAGDMIYRQAAIDALNSVAEYNARSVKAIKELPPVQPNHNAEVSKMEIVRCENCEHWDTSWETVYGLHYCPMIDMATKKNFFCKYGAEKRGGEADGND